MLCLPETLNMPYRSLKFVLFLFLIVFLSQCGVNDTPDPKVILEIEPEAKYSEFQKLIVIVADSNGITLDTLFEDSLSSPNQLKNLEFPGYSGEKIQIQIIGLKNDKISYSSVRNFDSKAPLETKVDTLFYSTSPVADAGDNITVFPTDTIRLSGTAFDPFSSFFVMEWDFGDGDFIPVTNGDTNILAPDSEGDLSFILRVSDDEGLQALDTVLITVAFSGNHFLAVLKLQNQTLSPDFAENTLEYSVQIPDSVDTLVITATPEDKGASVKIEGAVKTDSLYKYPLQTGENNISIVVTAANGDSSSYRLNVNKAASSKTSLKNLTSNTGQWDPEFSSDVFEYTLELDHNTKSILVNFETESSKAAVVFDSQNISGKGSFSIDSIPAGDSTVDFTVFAENEKDSQTFVLNLKRPGVYRIVQETPTQTDSLPWTSVFLGEAFDFNADTPTGYDLKIISVSSGSGSIEDKNSESARITSNSDSLVLTATYDTLKLSLRISAAEEVTFTPDSVTKVNYNIPQAITSSMEYGYHFKKWTVLEGSAVFDDSTKASTQVRLLEEDTHISPIFAPDTFTVSFSTSVNTETHNMNFCINNTCETELSSFVQKRTYGEELVITVPSRVECKPQGPVACDAQCFEFLSFSSVRSGAFAQLDTTLTISIADDSQIGSGYGDCP